MLVQHGALKDMALSHCSILKSLRQKPRVPYQHSHAQMLNCMKPPPCQKLLEIWPKEAFNKSSCRWAEHLQRGFLSICLLSG